MDDSVRKISVLLPVLAPVVSLALLGAQADQAQTVLAAMREALGGEKKIDAIKTLKAEGTYRRTMGEMERSGDFDWTFVLPDKFQRGEQFQLPTGMPGPRIAWTFNGTEGWIDGPPGGVMRPAAGMVVMVGPGGPGGAVGPDGRRPDPTPLIRGEFYRTLLAVLPASPGLSGLTFTHAGQAESNDGTADVLDVKSERFAARLFVDSKTHLPLMLTYMAPPQRVQFGQRRPDETPEQIRKRFEEERAKMASMPPVEHTIFFSDHKKVEGVLLPHRLTRAVDGKTTEEIEIKAYKANVTVDPQTFEKKAS
jgi:hypothetical protein